ncbi:MAG: VOC family protein [Thermoanaerobaculia bacterium]
MSTKPVGSIGWIDLTIEDAPAIRDFYSAVVGWKSAELDMGGYPDFVLSRPGDDESVAGVCHARGGNAGLPPVWMIYIVVADLDASLEQVRARGGEVLSPVRKVGADRYAVIRDPAGAAAALYQFAGA